MEICPNATRISLLNYSERRFPTVRQLPASYLEGEDRATACGEMHYLSAKYDLVDSQYLKYAFSRFSQIALGIPGANGDSAGMEDVFDDTRRRKRFVFAAFTTFTFDVNGSLARCLADLCGRKFKGERKSWGDGRDSTDIPATARPRGGSCWARRPVPPPWLCERPPGSQKSLAGSGGAPAPRRGSLPG